MTDQKKRELTKEHMKLVRRRYERIQSEYERLSGSRGKVSAWGGLGGSSHKIAKPTEDQALAAIELEEKKRAQGGWFECIRGTYYRLCSREGKSPNLWRHHKLVARALQLYVFERADQETMVMMMSDSRRLSRQYVSRILSEAVNEVMKDAERAHLFDGLEPAQPVSHAGDRT